MNEQQQQQYIEHEVKIRVLRETTDSKFESMHNEFALMLKNSDDKFASMEKRIDDRFKAIDKELSKIDSKINWFFGVVVSGVFVSIFLKVIGVF